MRETNLKIVAHLAQSGTLGVALLLGAAPSATAAQPADREPAARSPGQRVAERLTAIREAVSAGAESQTVEGSGTPRLAQWHNGGYQPWGNGYPWGNGHQGGSYGYPWGNGHQGGGYGYPWGNSHQGGGYGYPWGNGHQWGNR